MRILHITAHMGAGAGKAISGLAILDTENEHRIILLDKPEKSNHIDRCRKKGIEIMICPDAAQIKKESLEADVIIVNWWHHPLTYKTLLLFDGISSRMILWCHVNGLSYPKLKPEFIRCFDACMFTSKVTLQNSDWSDADKEIIHSKSELVYGMGDFNPRSFGAKKNYACNREIRIGFAGSLDYAKLHPDFTSWIKSAVSSNENIRFMIAGDVTQLLIEDVKKERIYEKTEFLGFRKDIPGLLETWDAFIYPLNPFNFATTENALLEAMAVGLPVVASDGIVERSIIQNGVDGFLVSDGPSFAAKVNELTRDEGMRRSIGQRARENVIKTYDAKENLQRFQHILEQVAKYDKERRYFTSVIGSEAFYWFLLGCQEEERALFEKASEIRLQNGLQGREWMETAKSVSEIEQIFKGDSKGSAKQFSKYYPKDKRLDSLSKMIAVIQEKDI